MAGLVFIDIETTGLRPEVHVPWEIAIITDSGEYSWIFELTPEELGRADSMALSIGRYYTRVNRAAQEAEQTYQFGREWPSRKRQPGSFTTTIASSENCLEEQRLRMKDSPWVPLGGRVKLAEFLAVATENSHLVGAVPSFDERRVGDFMRQFHYPPSWHYRLIDVQALAAGHLKKTPPWKSKDLYRAIGVDPSQFDAHTALGDARMAKAVYETVMALPEGVAFDVGATNSIKGATPSSVTELASNH